MLFPENDAPADARLRRELAEEQGIYRVFI